MRRTRNGLSAGLAASALLLPLACQMETRGELVELGWQLRLAPDELNEAVLSADAEPWRLELTEARIALGPIYALAPRVAALRWFGANVAHAHAGDDNNGGAQVVAEQLEPVVVDLSSASELSLPSTYAEAGPVDQLNVSFDPRWSTLDGDLAVAEMVVRAIGPNQESFYFTATLDALPEGIISRRVDSIDVGGADIARGATLEVHVRPTAWLSEIRVERLVQELIADGGVLAEFDAPEHALVVEAPSQLHNAWYQALRNPGSWAATIRMDSRVSEGTQP